MPKPSLKSGVVSLFALLAAATLGGCSPVTFAFTFGADPLRVAEVPVAEDKNAQDKVVMIDIRGLIADDPGEGLGPFLLGAGNPVDELTYRLEMAERDPRVKAVILRINSPGGTVTASDMMYREVRRFAERSKKPVLASLGEVAASGGYYLALAADEIIAEPTSITGSIGVIVPTLNVSEGLAKIGIKARNVKSGSNKDMGDPLVPAREEHYALIQTLVDEYYAQFKSLVVARRTPAGLKAEFVDELTDGRVVTGTRAAAVGLVDKTGGIRDAFDAAKVRAGISTAKLVKYHSRGSRPRSPYATATEPPAASAGAAPTGAGDFNLINLQLGNFGPGSRSTNVYYLWAP